MLASAPLCVISSSSDGPLGAFEAMSIWHRIFGKPTKRQVLPLKSPVAWISDDVWSQWMDDTSSPFRCPISDPRVLVATAADRERAPCARVSQGEAAPVAAFSDQQGLLLGTPWAHFGALSAAWPVCCSRLATLFWDQGWGPPLKDIEFHTGPLDMAYLEGEIGESLRSREEARRELELGFVTTLALIRAERHCGDGIVLFQCRDCWRIFLASCHP
jgi:hypothetical protein